MPNIYEYQDYREYLGDYYRQEKQARKNFSYRWFAEKAGINASAFLYYVIQGKRNLTKASIVKISRAIGHDRGEGEYFENLVFFNQAGTIADKALYYGRVVEARRPVVMDMVDNDRYAFYSHWRHSVIRELAALVDFQDDFQELAMHVQPPVTAREAKESVELLVRLGFLRKDRDGRYHQTNKVIGARSEGHLTLVIERFQQEMLDLARKSFAAFPRQDRMNASTTFCVSKATFELFKLKTREFRRELLEIARLDDDPEDVYQFTFNLFPVGTGRKAKRGGDARGR